ncbi:hypothetical protein QYE76_036977 [Lolium multiflorum]|uniref:Transposon protein, putative, CACTA, En/Spm sub-class n=1 Tax=Lolium multiflorum TaxID=4521 RepID=A0AAD8R5F7_LOLMU|nr:hypothetical protein QYE76_036977 [Lolium multiflorum]
MMEDGDEEEDNDEKYRSMFSECFDTAMDDNEEEGGEEQASDDPVDDDLRRAISDARRDCDTDKERLQFDKMLEDHHKLLYPGCEDGHRKLGSILELLKWKAEVGVTDSGFEKLMIILKKLFPRNNELPVSTYEAKKLVCPLGLDVQKIHACINDCILYRGEKYENLNKCPICGALRYKIGKDDPGDVEGEPPRKRVPAKVMWYAPIIPRLKRLFRNKEHAKLLRWHMEERKKDAMLRHPADGRQWRNIGREFPDFAEMASPINFNQFLEREKLKSNGSNFTDWFRHVRIFLSNLQFVLDAPLGDPPAEDESDEVKAVYATRKTRYSQVQCAILCSLESDLQKRFEHHDPHELMNELKAIFETHAAVECYEASKHFFSCMMEEGSSVSEHMLAMTGHAKKLSDLGIVIPNRLGINRVLQSLPPSYKNFVMNYNMQNMNKELPKLLAC